MTLLGLCLLFDFAKNPSTSLKSHFASYVQCCLSFPTNLIPAAMGTTGEAVLQDFIVVLNFTVKLTH